MHTLLGLSSLLLVVVASHATLGVLRRLGGWSRRRDLQFVVLAAPVVSLGLGLGALYHFTGRTCFLGAPPWDYVAGLALPLGMGLVALGGIGLGLVRLVLMARLVGQRGVPAGNPLRTLVGRLSARLGVAPPRVRLCAYDRPLALTVGLWRPTLLLSTWMLERLDARELEAVLAHELGHVARRDYLVIWLATVLRDAFCYLPTSWIAYRQLQQEKELACDDLAAGVTQRPLALASALAKVWYQAVERSAFGTAQSLAGGVVSIEDRIERLLAAPMPASHPPRSRFVALGIGGSALGALLVLQAVNAAFMLVPMGCGPAVRLWSLL